MPKVLTDGKVSIGAFMFPDRKRPMLCIEKGNQCVCYGHFNSIDGAKEFMNELGKLVCGEMELEDVKNNRTRS